MRIAIVDDLQIDRIEVRKLVEEFCLNRFEKLSNEIVIEEFNSGEDLLCNFQPNYYDIIILDIYMEKLTGMDTARKVFSLDKSCNLIFLTTSEDYIFDSFEVRAVFYIMKPVTLHREKLFTALSFCIDNLKLDTSTLEILVNKKPMNLLLSDIIYVDSERRLSKFHTTSTTLISHRSLNNYSEKLLKDKRFMECFRGILVNMDYIDTVNEEDFILKNKEKLPISKRKKATIKNNYFEYFIKKRGV